MSDRTPASRPEPLLYDSYLLRLWRDTDQAKWRASAQSVRTGRIVYFGSLAVLFAYLASQVKEEK